MTPLLSKTVDLRTLLDLASFALAVWSLMKVRSANKAVRAERLKLFRQQAAKEFNAISFGAIALEGQIRVANIQRIAELAIDLIARLSNARGAWASLLTIDESAAMDMTSQRLDDLRAALPVGGAAIDEGTSKKMAAICLYVVKVVSPIYGKLKYEQMGGVSWLKALWNRTSKFLMKNR